MKREIAVLIEEKTWNEILTTHCVFHTAQKLHFSLYFHILH